ncbi:MAG: exodeoxyribonuclease VII small subunit [Gemmataceae bacterium]|nr:exodeoxyribonuclease VII small subunit [Gemmataceae bacterium]MDW8265088.1 exodeoxyribonuclease VII small subunit [Gemmataceae bacterium]
MTEVPAEQLTFEEALTQLERIVRELESGEIGLEQALASYENGIALLKRCYNRLREAEQRIVLLTGVDEEGRPTTVPFEHAGAVEPAEKTAGRRRRKKKSDESQELF